MNELTKKSKHVNKPAAGFDLEAAYEVLFRAYIRTYRKEEKAKTAKGEEENGKA